MKTRAKILTVASAVTAMLLSAAAFSSADATCLNEDKKEEVGKCVEDVNGIKFCMRASWYSTKDCTATQPSGSTVIGDPEP